MIINSYFLNLRLSVDDQAKEIDRIKKAPVGAVLFTTSTNSNTDVVETLLHMSGIRYHIGIAGYTAKYYKDE